MQIDYGVLIGFIGIACAAGVLGLSYVGAFLLGHSRGRREADLERRVTESQIGSGVHVDRILMIEGAVSSMAQAVERLSEAQRIALLERARSGVGSETRGERGRISGHNTPA